MRANIVQLDVLPNLLCDGEISTFYLYVCFSLHCFHLKLTVSPARVSADM